MSSATLKLFRRHDSRCTGFFNPKTRQQEPYGKEDRIYEADTEKRKGKPAVVDCRPRHQSRLPSVFHCSGKGRGRCGRGARAGTLEEQFPSTSHRPAEGPAREW